jgi:hypothetical protein
LGKDHGFAADAQHFAQDALGVAHGLQGARQHDVVEGLVGEFVEALFQVALDDVDAVAMRRGRWRHRSRRPSRALAAGVDQVLAAGAVAAAEVEHAVARLDPARDEVEVGAAQGMCHSLMFRR